MRAQGLPWVLLLLALLLGACRALEEGPSLEAQAQALERGLICPVCPGETLDQSQVPLAKQMREFIREKLGEGWTREQVVQYFVDRYGEGVLAAPPRQGLGLLAWLFPPVALVLGLGILMAVVRAMSRPTPQLMSPSEKPGDPYLDLVERERGGLSESRPPPQG